MLTLRLPDGSTRQVPPGTRPRDVAEAIGKRLAQAAVAAKVNGDILDLDRELPADARLAFGPALDNGFYYDIDATPPIRDEDFPRIEAEMRKIVTEAEPFERFERPTAEARALVQDMGQSFKVEHIDDDLKQYPSLSFY